MMTIKILSLNIEGDKHLAAVKVLLQKEQPDVICFQEIFEHDFHQLRSDLCINGLFQPAINVNAGGRPGYRERGVMGVAIFGNFPGKFHRAYYFKKLGENIPLYSGIPNAGHRALVWQTINTPERSLTIATTHFTWSKGGKTTEKQRKELRSLFKLLDKVQPDILCGDFNAPRGGEIYSALSKRFVDNIPSHIKSTIDPTMHYSHGSAELVVDGFFTTPECQPIEVRLVNGVSDHLAIIATICA